MDDSSPLAVDGYRNPVYSSPEKKIRGHRRMTRRELFKHSAKVAWVAPTVTPLFAAQLQPRWALQMYKARFVQKTSSGQRYADVCDAECREWFHDNKPYDWTD
jgi:hypothetical protein